MLKNQKLLLSLITSSLIFYNSTIIFSDSPSNNTISINKGDSYDKNLFGGSTDNPNENSKNNTITMTNGNTKWIIGGYSNSGNSINNNIFISNGIIDGNVYGGESVSGNVVNNNITISGGNAKWLIGGYSNSGNVVNNNIVVSGGTFSGSITGGYNNFGNSIGNKVTFSNITLDNFLQGGYSKSGSTLNNTLIIKNGSILKGVFGGYVNLGSGEASNNKVIIHNGNIGNSSSGTSFLTAGGHSNNGDANSNYILVENGTIENSLSGGSSDSGNVSKNTVLITGGNLNILHGGRTDRGDAIDNNVTFLQGNSRSIHGGKSNSGDATSNTITINGGSVLDIIAGGWSTNSGNASKNIIDIYDGKLGSSIFGGYAPDGDATENIINIHKNINLANTDIYGGFSQAKDKITGNILNMSGVHGNIKRITNFETINLTLANENSKINITDGEFGDLAGTTLNITRINKGGKALKPGENLSLLSSNVDISSINIGNLSNIKKGNFLIYSFEQDTTSSDEIKLTVKNRSLSSNVFALGESQIAGLNLLNQGSNLLADKGLKSIEINDEIQLYSFAAISGNNSHYNINSIKNMDSFNLIAGLAKSIPIGKEKILIGIFYENGTGNYKTSHGSGKASYDGGGFIANYKAKNNFYSEGSVHLGRLKNNFDGLNIEDEDNKNFNISNHYYGLNLEVGKIISINGNTSANIYGKYLYMHQRRINKEIFAENIDFNNIDSSRIQVGTRFNHKNNNLISSYGGITWEYEFDGESKYKIYDISTDTPSIKGNSGITEIGIKVSPVSPLIIELGAKGYFGKNKGLSGNFQLTYSF